MYIHIHTHTYFSDFILQWLWWKFYSNIILFSNYVYEIASVMYISCFLLKKFICGCCWHSIYPICRNRSSDPHVMRMLLISLFYSNTKDVQMFSNVVIKANLKQISSSIRFLISAKIHSLLATCWVPPPPLCPSLSFSLRYNRSQTGPHQGCSNWPVWLGGWPS